MPGERDVNLHARKGAESKPNGATGVTSDTIAVTTVVTIAADPLRTAVDSPRSVSDSQRTAVMYAMSDPDSTRTCGNMTIWTAQMSGKTC